MRLDVELCNALQHTFDCNTLQRITATQLQQIEYVLFTTVDFELCKTLQQAASYCNPPLQHAVTQTATNKLQQTTTQTATQPAATTHTATNSNKHQQITAHCNTLHHLAAHCNAPQCTATPCNTLQHTRTHCNTHMELFLVDFKICCAEQKSVLQHIATHTWNSSL